MRKSEVFSILLVAIVFLMALVPGAVKAQDPSDPSTLGIEYNFLKTEGLGTPVVVSSGSSAIPAVMFRDLVLVVGVHNVTPKLADQVTTDEMCPGYSCNWLVQYTSTHRLQGVSTPAWVAAVSVPADSQLQITALDINGITMLFNGQEVFLPAN